MPHDAQPFENSFRNDEQFYNLHGLIISINLFKMIFPILIFYNERERLLEIKPIIRKIVAIADDAPIEFDEFYKHFDT